MNFQVVIILLVLCFLAFVGFAVYFFFKVLEFVIKAVNLYEKMINRQDMIIKLLSDKKGNGGTAEKTIIESTAANDKISDDKQKIKADREAELQQKIWLQNQKVFQQSKCPECGEDIDKKLNKCFACDADLSTY